MSNSPPSNVRLGSDEPARPLASGIDSLVLAIDVRWTDAAVFERLADLKALAKAANEEEPSQLAIGDDFVPWLFNVMPHGARGYEWMLISQWVVIRVGNWMEPTQRPSVMVEIRSETLWTLGTDASVDRVCQLIRALGGDVVEIKPSRVDLCTDILLPASDWTVDLIDCFVTRARDISPHFQSRELSGFSIGKSKVSARIYDKPREIKAKSRKFWMNDIWNVESVADSHRIIRVEFQIRREALRDFRIDRWIHLQYCIAGLWAYCTTEWLRIVDDASVHHTQQHELAWWIVTRQGFKGAQNATPLVRSKSITLDKRQLAAQALGSLSSILSVDLDSVKNDPGTLDMSSHLQLALGEAIKHSQLDDAEFTHRISRKQSRRQRPGGVSPCPPGAGGGRDVG